MKSACVQETIFVLNFSSLKWKAPNVIFIIYFTNTVVCINFILYYIIIFFPVSFQTDKPMTPFLVEILEELLRGFYSKFIWPYILANAKTTTFLLKTDVSNCTNQLSTSKINISFSLKYDLQQLKRKGKMFRSTSSRGEYVISLSRCALITVIFENKEEFLSFDKDKDCFDYFS